MEDCDPNFIVHLQYVGRITRFLKLRQEWGIDTESEF
jgi:hypothetical protein